MQHYTAEMDQSSIEELISLFHSHINFLFTLFFNKTCLNNQSSKMYFIIVLNQITSTVTIQQAAVILKQKAKYNDWNQILQIEKNIKIH